MADKIGPTFPSELAAAGLGDGITWDRTSGTLTFTNVSDADQAKAQQVLAAHDPTRQAPVNAVTSKQFSYALNHLSLRARWDAAYPNQKQDDRDWFTLGDDPFPIAHKRIVRMMTLAGLDAGTVMAQAVEE